MDIQAYIQSGIVESYVLGLTSAEETTEVESLRTKHHEVEEAINEFALAVEEQVFENAIPPPPELKAKIIAAIKEEEGVDEAMPLARHLEEGLVVPISSMRNWRMVAAAAVILLIVSAALNYYFFNQYSAKKEAYQALLSESQTLQANNEVYQTQLKEWQSAAAMMADTAMAMVKMRSTRKGKDDAATVFWNTQTKDVYVMVNKLPDPQSGKQYQLWAMVDGKPVDAGVLDPSCSSVCKMKNIPKAEAFAITLEKEGGNRTPNLKAIFVMGNI